MARARKYSRQDVNDILYASERRLSPVSGERGHALEKHVGVGGLQISDRLRGTLTTSTTRPLVMDEFGKVRPEAEHRDIWRRLTPGSTTKQLKQDFRTNIENFVSRSGSFIDLQQAIIVGKYVLNCQEGQAALAKLDQGLENRVAVTVSMHSLEWTQGAWKMNFASRENDITHEEEFGKAFMLIDKLDLDQIHIQTFFPLK
ncbi:hypothetical protein Q9L42_016355 [Methylomarinum sp. Ch1-1]|uniref:Uncharacterized protein n=1 Tax=Methylomarinum roseum TaxID=3067653 RepID=A0AAU7NTH0_9GAMM|nr:hypothetical protein [Methylomarinum sp. Ch1-1]MDP4520096.1 hypothetical protein [Methylomarinum sp. Ch1-1]